VFLTRFPIGSMYPMGDAELAVRACRWGSRAHISAPVPSKYWIGRWPHLGSRANAGYHGDASEYIAICDREQAPARLWEDRAMKTFGVPLLAAVFLFVTVAPASAHGHGHAPFWPFLAPLLLPVAVVATVTAGVATVATGVATAVTAPFTYPYGAAAVPPTYAPAPAAVYAPAPAYARPVYAAAPPPTPSYWYYCPSAGGYYPYVRGCPGGWLTVVPR
jgi:hypothetical protein